jgi:hypothetical protein
MMTILTERRKEIWMATAAVLLLCGLSQIAVAAGGWLVVRQMDGRDWLYSLSEIEGISYGTDEFFVTTANGTDTFALEQIAGIEFGPAESTAGVDDPGGPPVSVAQFHLYQNSPNPFSPNTQIGFDLPSAGRAEIRVYDAEGRLIRTLMDENRPAGLHSVRWDGRDEAGRAMASGVYFYTLTAPGVDENRRMILVK